jgi:hypothetical protein
VEKLSGSQHAYRIRLGDYRIVSTTKPRPREILSTVKWAKYAKNPGPSPESFPVSRISRICGCLCFLYWHGF